MTTNVKIVVLGDGGVGKTALTLRLSLNFFVETYDPTIEDSYRKQAIIDGQPYMLEILDTAGQEEYTALRDQWIGEGEAFLIVYSVTSRASFDRVEKFRTQVARVKDSDTVPVVLVGNKIDRVHEREVETRHGEQLAQRLGGCAFVETSAKTRENLEEAFFTAVRMVERQKGGSAAKPVRKQKRSPRKCTLL